MVITAPRQSDPIEKLLKLADGDREMVHKAIRDEVDPRTGSADLGKVVKRIRDALAARKQAA